MNPFIIYLLIGFVIAAIEVTFSRDVQEKLQKARQTGLHPIVLVTMTAVLWLPLAIFWLFSKLTEKK